MGRRGARKRTARKAHPPAVRMEQPRPAAEPKGGPDASETREQGGGLWLVPGITPCGEAAMNENATLRSTHPVRGRGDARLSAVGWPSVDSVDRISPAGTLVS